MIFEMATGDFLFEPRKGTNYGKDDDHLAQMMELLGRMPKSMAIGGKRSRKFFNTAGSLRRIQGLNFWPLKKVLMEKYKFNEVEAFTFAEFLEPLLDWDPDKRASAETALSHRWLTMPSNYETRMTTEEFQLYKMKTKEKGGVFASDYMGDASTEYYNNAEMAQLTDSENEYMPADDEWQPGPKQADLKDDMKDEVDEDNRLEDFFRNDFDDDGSGYFFSDEVDDVVIKKQGLKLHRDLAEGQNLNNSFGCYSPEDWDHLHVDKGNNPQFDILKPRAEIESSMAKKNSETKSTRPPIAPKQETSPQKQ